MLFSFCVGVGRRDRAVGAFSGADDDLTGVGQARAEAYEQHGLAGPHRGPRRACGPGPAGSTPTRCCPSDDVVGDAHVVAGARLRSRFATASMMRRLAWCGTKHVDVGGGEAGQLDRAQRHRGDRGGGPAEHRLALLVQGAVSRVDPDRLATGRPRCPRPPARPRRLASGAGPTTAAPAPSAKMMQVERSSQSIQSESFSAPITRACADGPGPDQVRGDGDAVAKPAHAVLRSNAAGAGMPIRCATWAAALGMWSSIVQVATMTGSMSPAVQPGVLDRAGAGVGGHVDQQRVLLRDAPALDADPVADPLVVGLDARGEVVVGDDPSGWKLPSPSRRAPVGARRAGLIGRSVMRGSQRCSAATSSRRRPGRRAS